MAGKFARLCWNTNGWRQPSGDAPRLENGTYVARNGFGHEEWLFNFEWVMDGYRFGFLQPIGRFRSSYVRRNFHVMLYTVAPGGAVLLVGSIRNLYVPEDDETTEAVREIYKKGWVAQMQEDVARVGGNPAALGHPTPADLINVRFRPEDVQLFRPLPRVHQEHTIAKVKRYQPFDWNESAVPGISTAPPQTDPKDPKREEHQRLRAAQEGTAYDPRHVRLQNRLYDYLVERYGKPAVFYERAYVDLTVSGNDGTTFYEVKMETTVRGCVRAALGQLLEYAHYPAEKKASALIVVGDAIPTSDDQIYLRHIRALYEVPIWYARFHWEKGTLSDRY